MALSIQITEAFRKENGDVLAVDLILSAVRGNILEAIKGNPSALNTHVVIALNTEKPSKAVQAVQDIDNIVKQCSHDGLSDSSLKFVLEKASKAPLGPGLEIGSYKGGTALALLHLRDWPLFVTVDPYGGKPYEGGDIVMEKAYQDAFHVIHKTNLSSAENHTHFLMTGLEFLERNAGFSYWKNGVEKKFENLAFAFVDGQHDKNTVLKEVWALLPLMDAEGIIVIDNIDKDPELQKALIEMGAELGPETEPGARQAVL